MRPRNCAHKIILLYHRIASVECDPWGLCVTREHFAEHLEILRKHFPVRLSEIQSSQRPYDPDTCSVAVTFDDGYADNFEQAAPLLAHYEVPATFFIVTEYMDGTREFWWDELERLVFQINSPLSPLELRTGDRALSVLLNDRRSRRELFDTLYEFLQPLSHDDRLMLMNQLAERWQQNVTIRPSHRVMTEDQISSLAAIGLFEMGAHTRTHPKLSGQTIGTQRAEILGSKTWLEGVIGHSVDSFSYPYGARHHYTQETVGVVRDCGFKYACTSAGRCLESSDVPLELPRIRVTDMDGRSFEMLLSR